MPIALAVGVGSPTGYYTVVPYLLVRRNVVEPVNPCFYQARPRPSYYMSLGQPTTEDIDSSPKATSTIASPFLGAHAWSKTYWPPTAKYAVSSYRATPESRKFRSTQREKGKTEQVCQAQKYGNALLHVFKVYANSFSAYYMATRCNSVGE